MVQLKQTLPFNTRTLRIPCKQSNMVRSYVQFPKAASLYGSKITLNRLFNMLIKKKKINIKIFPDEGRG